MRKILKSAALAGALAVASVGAVVATAQPAEAAPYNHARIKNSPGSDRSLRACQDWSGTKSDPGCKSGTRWVTLAPGQTTPAGDWDGYEVPSGCRDNYGNRGKVQVKVSGFFGRTSMRLLDC